LDGVYVEDEQGELRFCELPSPSSAEVANIARRTARCLHQAIKKKGRPSPWDDEHAWGDSGESDLLSVEQPGLFVCHQAAVSGVAVWDERARQPVLRLVAGGQLGAECPSESQLPAEPVAEALGSGVARDGVNAGEKPNSGCGTASGPALSHPLRLEAVSPEVVGVAGAAARQSPDTRQSWAPSRHPGVGLAIAIGAQLA